MTILISGCINQQPSGLLERGCVQLLTSGCKEDLSDIEVDVGDTSSTLREICQELGMSDDECREKCGCPKLTTIPIVTTTAQETTTSISITTTIEQSNCSKALDITTIKCDAINNQLKIFINNKASDIELYDFTTTVEIELEPHTFTGVGPTETNPLDPEKNYILTYHCNDTICPDNAMVSKVKVTPGNCPEGWVEKEFSKQCET